MNRRDFLKAVPLAASIPAISITCRYEDDEKGPEKESSNGVNWDYRVYCYERGQGEWTFSQNIRGSFAYQREYITCEGEKHTPYAGWMHEGKLHFSSLGEAQDFVGMHVKAKDDTNLIDSIYDIYYISRGEPYHLGVGEEAQYPEKEIKVAQYWFNGDTGRQINWVADVDRA